MEVTREELGAVLPTTANQAENGDAMWRLVALKTLRAVIGKKRRNDSRARQVRRQGPKASDLLLSGQEKNRLMKMIFTTGSYSPLDATFNLTLTPSAR